MAAPSVHAEEVTAVAFSVLDRTLPPDADLNAFLQTGISETLRSLMQSLLRIDQEAAGKLREADLSLVNWTGVAQQLAAARAEI